MSEYIIDMGNSSYQSTSGLLCADVSQLREEIVRCSDCKYYDDCDAGCSYFVLAESKLLHIKNPNGFCAWRERRGE